LLTKISCIQKINLNKILRQNQRFNLEKLKINAYPIKGMGMGSKVDKSNSKRIIIALGLILIAISIVAFYILRPREEIPEKKYLFSGRVIDSATGSPLKDATVKVAGLSVKTDEDGRYRIELKPGNYSMTVEREGYTSRSEVLEIRDRDVSMTITLVKVRKPITLVILTRHDTTIQEKAKASFLASNISKELNIVDLRFMPSAGPLWEDYLKREGEVDVAWGGGPTLFDSLLKYWAQPTSKIALEIIGEIPDKIGGAPIKRFGGDGSLLWVASAISSFGYTVNNRGLSSWRLDKPLSWRDLASPGLALLPYPQLGIADPLRSTSHTRIYEIILQAYGWEEGWRVLALMAANSKIYDSSDAVREGVITGDLAIGITIDFYGYQAMKVNPDTEYIIPEGESIINGDPIALVASSRNREAAEAFIAWVLSPEGQKLWLDPSINRMPVNERVFETPEGRAREDLRKLYERTLKTRGIEFDDERALRTEMAMQQYFKAVLIDQNLELKRAWREVAKLRESDPKRYEELRRRLTDLISFKDPTTGKVESFTEEYAAAINPRLADPAFSDSMMRAWRDAARERFTEIYNLASR
jgi:ABC-type Fe3+ transport system substrate-binding protein